MRRGCVVIVFARPPSPGRTKTRLIPRLGEWRAARLQARLTERALTLARRSGAAVELHAAAHPRGAFFRHCATRFGVEVLPQRGVGLGARMRAALGRALRTYRAAVLIGTDCPALRQSDLERACRLLRGACDVVLLPVEDGGYALVGARRLAPAMFEGIFWGGPAVYRDTAQRLVAARVRWRALRRLWDLDRPQDVDRLGALAFAPFS
jgi:rSAM/selenodomain-associated transferase 1